MGKLSPSMRSAQLPFNLLKSPPSPSPSKPFSKSKPHPKIKKPKPQTQSQPQPPTLFTSPSLSSALSALNSLPYHSLSPSLILQSFLSLNPSPSDALSLFSHLHHSLLTLSLRFLSDDLEI